MHIANDIIHLYRASSNLRSTIPVFYQSSILIISRSEISQSNRMASSMCMRKVLKLMLVISICIVTGSAIRVDKQRGFKLCPGRQLGRIVSVEGGGADCRKSN